MEKNPKTDNIVNLPNDILRHIFSRLDVTHLRSTLAVCKIFFSVSIDVVRKLVIKDSSLSYQNILTLLHRYLSVKEISINCSDTVEDVLLAISNSSIMLNLEMLQISLPRFSKSADFLQTQSTSEVIFRSVRTLKLTFDVVGFVIPSPVKNRNWVDEFCRGDRDSEGKRFHAFRLHVGSANTFYGYFDFDWYDEGVRKIISKLPNLHCIDLSHNYWITDKTLLMLSQYCPYLESVDLQRCRISGEELVRYLCDNPQLTSINMPHDTNPVSQVVRNKQAIKHLNHISLDSDNVSHQVLTALVESKPPLKSLVIGHSTSNYGYSRYTMNGLSRVLSAFPGLVMLKVVLPDPVSCNNQDDKKMSLIVNGLPCLKHITVTSRIVCAATLFSLVQNCSLIETICLKRFGHTAHASEKQQKRQNINKSFVKSYIEDLLEENVPEKNYNIRSIEISPEDDIWLLEEVGFYCPKLEKQNKCTN